MTEAQNLSHLGSYGPTSKERKYDRQLRLWAASGQAALESANILLVNSGAGTVGIEALKNLVLPGIGKFTIADEATVTDADLGINFFVDEACLGQSRARCCMNNLVELNPEVLGDWFPKNGAPLDMEELLATSGPYSIILYTLPLHPKRVQLLDLYASQHNITLLAVHSVGYYSYFTIKQPGLLPIVDTHPDEALTADLRLLDPWPELSAFASRMTKNIDHQDNHDHGHLPFIVILLYFLEQWKESHGGKAPSTYNEKAEFRDIVANAARKNNPEGGEENFDEAVSAVMKHVTPSLLPPSLKLIFDNIGHDQDNTHFWVIAEAVKQFYSKHHQLPLPGGLPDMKAQSKVYLKLQSLFKNKARQDAYEVMANARAIPGGDLIELAEIELFCKNSQFIRLIQRSDSALDIAQVVENELLNDELAASAGPEFPDSLVLVYLSLKAMTSIPGATAQDIVDIVTRDMSSLLGNQRLVKVARELVRSHSGELHNVSAVTGGMVAQEMIKVITGQYVPIDNVCIFDGIESRCQVLRLRLGIDSLSQ